MAVIISPTCSKIKVPFLNEQPKKFLQWRIIINIILIINIVYNGEIYILH